MTITLEDQLRLLVNDENLCYSPLSVQIALAMLYPGSSGKSRKALEELGVHTLPELDYTDQDFNPQKEHSWDNDDPIVQFANSLWTNRDVFLHDKYALEVVRAFNAKLDHVDSNDPETSAERVNAWVASKTNDRIKNLVSSDVITEDLAAILVNAIYFRDSWVDAFRETDTQDCIFHTPSGDREVPTMRQTEEFRYCETDKAQAVSLATMGGYSLVCVKADDIKDCILNPFDLQMTKTNMNLSLPKFNIKQSIKLKDTLEALGMGDLFTPSSDFDEMFSVPGKMHVSEILQETFIEVHEKGLEAAAATAIVMVAMSMPALPPPPIDVVFDKPFMYYLVDHTKKTVLFAGSVLDPNQ